MATIRASARHYAVAVFAVARDQKSFDVWLGDLQRIQQALTDPTAEHLLTSPAVPEAERLQALYGLAPDLRPETRNLIQLLTARGRLELIPEILAAFQELVDRERGLVTAEVASAIPLDPSMQELIAKRLAEHTGRQVQLELSVDPDLIGGIVARIGDELIDDSIRGRLRRLKERLAHEPAS